jgi:hypothetical protein
MTPNARLILSQFDPVPDPPDFVDLLRQAEHKARHTGRMWFITSYGSDLYQERQRALHDSREPLERGECIDWVAFPPQRRVT